jgi:phage repressor protein C with HTH and peptisase S24 domain
MFTHAAIWAAIDGLAKDHAMTPSGLARRAGLDATSFNRSKRVNAKGRQRWPSTESIAKILTATGEPLTAFTARIAADSPSRRAVVAYGVTPNALPAPLVSGLRGTDDRPLPALA